MRYILFRGKPTREVLENESLCKTLPIKDGFVYGNLIYNDKQPYIVGPIADVNDEYCSMEWWCPVVKETVGQFTGLHDATKWEDLTDAERYEWIKSGHTKEHWKGRRIFEGDIVHIDNYDEGWDSVVEFNGGAFAVDVEGRDYDYTAIGWTEIIIGNIHDNQELLEEA